MSREIKFRAWDKARRQMFEVTQIKWSAYTTQAFSSLELLSMDGNYTMQQVDGLTTSISDIYEIIQFTGAKDKHGKEIYEGDILFSHALDASRTNDDYHIADAGVSLPAGVLLFAHLKNDPLNTPVAFSDAGSLEVIGNIYKHPDLVVKR